MKRTLISFKALALIALLFVVSCDLSNKNETTSTKVKRGYWGENFTSNIQSDVFLVNDLNMAEIVRDKATKETTIVFRNLPEGCSWEVFAGTDPANINMKTPILAGSRNGSYAINLPIEEKNYFQIVTKNPKMGALITERKLAIEATAATKSNFRDVGGYETRDGKYVKWGQILRGVATTTLTAADLNYLESFPLVSLIDLRGPAEYNATPDKVPTGATLYHYEFNLHTGDIYGGSITQLNRNMVTHPVCIENFTNIFKLMLDGETPMYFHCSAGKDRTGMTAALILLALGVDAETVMNEYMLSTATYYYGPGAVLRDWLQAGFDQMKTTYGTPEGTYEEAAENFIANTLNVDLKKLRSMYLY